jgi:putative membrane-bound dehydrogenase-like protein
MICSPWLRWTFAACLSFSLLVTSSGSAADPAPVIRSFQRQQLDDRFFCEGATFGDLDADGHADLVAGPFWFAGPDFKEQHEYYTPKPFDPLGYSDNFFAYTYDFNGDKALDILIIGFPGKQAYWYQNPGDLKAYRVAAQKPDVAPKHWVRHEALAVVDNESPTFTNFLGDSRPEIVAQQGGYFGYAEFAPANPTAPWTFHRISDKSAGGNFTHGMGVGDVNGDGRLDFLEKGGWWEQPEKLDDTTPWKKHPFPFNGGGAQMYAEDLNGDGRADVITSLQAHGFGLVWWEQTAGKDGEPGFEKHVILGNTAADNPHGVIFSELHALDFVDMNGDGLKDIVTGKRWWSHGPKGDPGPTPDGLLYWFERRVTKGTDGKRTVEWLPHFVDGASGVGTQVVAGDFSGDGLPDIVVGNKQGIFAFTQKTKQVTLEEYQRYQRRMIRGRAKPGEMQQGLSPVEAAKAMTVPPGFSVSLFAGEPDVKQPIAMAIDDRGRLWVAEAYSYPVKVPADQAKDRILIFEDANGDGTFDKKTVFIEGLNLVSGLEVGHGGVWVGMAPEFIFIPDANRDDKPDGPAQVLLDGWGYQDTHETLNSFIWGPDGWLYGCHGVFTHSRVGKPGTPDEKRIPINAGIWRYHPTRHVFEVFAEGTSNPWGVDFNDRGHAFATACVIPHLYHIIQGARYQRQAGVHFNPYVFDDIKTIARHRHWTGNQWNEADRQKSNEIGGGHAHAGAMVYLGGAWPDEYHNQLFMNNIHGSRLNMDRLFEQDSGYYGDAAPDFLFANDAWSQILYMTYGPDGQVYMIDWYDQNQCHHGRTPDHDRRNGRIFKISFDDGTTPAKGAKPLDVARLTDAELVALQTHANEWYSRHARRVLAERKAAGSLEAETVTLVSRRLNDETDPVRRLRFLWALHAVGGTTPETLLRLTHSAAIDVRAWSVQLACEAGAPGAELTARFAEMAATSVSPTERLYLASAIQRLPVADRWGIAQGLLKWSGNATDHNIPYVLWYGLEPCVAADPARAIALTANSKVPLVSRFIARRAAFEEQGLAALVASLGTADDNRVEWMLEEMVAALKFRDRVPAPAAWTDVYTKLAASKSDIARQNASFVAVKFGDKRVFGLLRSAVADRKADAGVRLQALETLVAGRDDGLPPVLHKLLDEATIRPQAIAALGNLDHADTPTALIGVYDKLPVAERQATIAALAGRPAYTLALLDAMERGQVPRTDLTAFTVRQIARGKDERVLKRLSEVWGTLRETSTDKAADFAKFRKQFQPAQLKDANLPEGRVVYNKTCGNCHQLFGVGTVVGPDLTGSNRANLEYLLENLLDPSALVGKDYQMTIVEMKDGRTLNGLAKQENAETLTLATPTGTVTLAKKEIEERVLSTTSLMPEGQVQQLTPEQARNLVAYLASPTQVPLPGEGPYLDPNTGRVAGALEGESLKVLQKTGGNTSAQGMGGFTLSKWSGNSQLWWTGGKPGDVLELAVPVAAPGEYEVYVVLTKAIDYARVEVGLDGHGNPVPVDLFNEGVVTTPAISLGTHALEKGDARLRLKITGANDKAVKGYMAAVDYVWLRKK